MHFYAFLSSSCTYINTLRVIKHFFFNSIMNNLILIIIKSEYMHIINIDAHIKKILRQNGFSLSFATVSYML